MSQVLSESDRQVEVAISIARRMLDEYGYELAIRAAREQYDEAVRRRTHNRQDIKDAARLRLAEVCRLCIEKGDERIRMLAYAALIEPSVI